MIGQFTLQAQIVCFEQALSCQAKPLSCSTTETPLSLSPGLHYIVDDHYCFGGEWGNVSLFCGCENLSHCNATHISSTRKFCSIPEYIYRPRSREIMHLVASVRPSVCLFVCSLPVQCICLCVCDQGAYAAHIDTVPCYCKSRNIGVQEILANLALWQN